MSGSNEEEKAAGQNENDGDNQEGLIAFCHCKAQLVPLRADTIYEKFVPVFCNDCWGYNAPEQTVYHCARGKKGRCWDHPVGYDICVQCAKKQQRDRIAKEVTNEKNDTTQEHQTKGGSGIKKWFHSKKNSNSNAKINADDNETNKSQNDVQRMQLNLSPTLECILTQQIVLSPNHVNADDDSENNEEKHPHSRNAVSHLSVLDEVGRLSALSHSSLRILAHHNVNHAETKHSVDDLQAMVIKCSALLQLQQQLNTTIDALSVQSYAMLDRKLRNWRVWNSNELWQWIKSLEDGRFYHKYCVAIEHETDKVNVVKQSILKQNIRGKHLELEDSKKDLLMQSMGITDFDDRMTLLDHIQALKDEQFKYDQILALVPPRNEEIPGHAQQENNKDQGDENNEEAVVEVEE